MGLMEWDYYNILQWEFYPLVICNIAMGILMCFINGIFSGIEWDFIIPF